MIQRAMANTKSAKKALRQSKRKYAHNQFWKRRIQTVVKSLRKHMDDKVTTFDNKASSIDIIKKEQSVLYKIVDKAAKEKAIHKNKARRIKSKISKKVAAHEKTNSKSPKKPQPKKAKSTDKKAKTSA